jgi:Flp pilus assembly protein TadD
MPEAGLSLGAVLTQRGDYEEAERWLHAALAAGVPEAEVNLGTLHRSRGNSAQARGGTSARPAAAIPWRSGHCANSAAPAKVTRQIPN